MRNLVTTTSAVLAHSALAALSGDLGESAIAPDVVGEATETSAVEIIVQFC